MKPIGSFGIVAFKQSQKIHFTLDRIIKWSKTCGVPVFFHPVCASYVDNGAHVCAHVCASEEELLSKSEALVSVGGDGAGRGKRRRERFDHVEPVVLAAAVNDDAVGHFTMPDADGPGKR